MGKAHLFMAFEDLYDVLSPETFNLMAMWDDLAWFWWRKKYFEAFEDWMDLPELDIFEHEKASALI